MKKWMEERKKVLMNGRKEKSINEWKKEKKY